MWAPRGFIVLCLIVWILPGAIINTTTWADDGNSTYNYAGSQPAGSEKFSDPEKSCKSSDKSIYTIRYCTEVIRDPDTPDDVRIVALSKRAKSWVIEEELRAAIRDYNQLAEIKPDHVEAIFERAKLYARLGEFESSKNDYTRVIEIDDENVSAYCERGFTGIQLKDYQSAIDDYTTGLNKDPKRLDCVVGRGDAYLGQGDEEKALREYSVAIAANERYWEAYFHRAELYKKRGQKQLAIADYSTVLKLDFLNLTAAKSLRALGVLSPFPFTDEPKN